MLKVLRRRILQVGRLSKLAHKEACTKNQLVLIVARMSPPALRGLPSRGVPGQLGQRALRTARPPKRQRGGGAAAPEGGEAAGGEGAGAGGQPMEVGAPADKGSRARARRMWGSRPPPGLPSQPRAAYGMPSTNASLRPPHQGGRGAVLAPGGAAGAAGPGGGVAAAASSLILEQLVALQQQQVQQLQLIEQIRSQVAP